MYFWSGLVVDMAKDKNILYFDLKNTDANKANLESYTRKHSPTLIFVNGHGNNSTLTGHDNQSIIDINSKVTSKVIYARSCDAALILGPKLVRNGVGAFIGYKRKFTLCYLAEFSTKPLKDPIAKNFLEPSNLVATTLMKGHSANEANTRSKNEMFKNFRRMLSSEASDDEKYAARWLWGNINNQILVGDQTITAV